MRFGLCVNRYGDHLVCLSLPGQVADTGCMVTMTEREHGDCRWVCVRVCVREAWVCTLVPSLTSYSFLPPSLASHFCRSGAHASSAEEGTSATVSLYCHSCLFPPFLPTSLAPLPSWHTCPPCRVRFDTRAVMKPSVYRDHNYPLLSVIPCLPNNGFLFTQ